MRIDNHVMGLRSLNAWRGIRIAALNALLMSLSFGCSKKSEPDSADGMSVVEDAGVVDMSAADVMVADVQVRDRGIACATLDDCSNPICADAPVCQPCEEGGNCLYTGQLRIFGEAVSNRRQTISDLRIRAVCGNDEVSAVPGEDGRYELNIEVDQCSHLVLVAERAPGTEGYVPVVRRIQMPPPVNTMEIDFAMQPGEEIRCDGTICVSRSVYRSYDTGEFFVGYGYGSGELNDVDYFGAIFESTDGQLLWLHRYAYYEFRDANSNRLNDIFFGDNSGLYSTAELTFETRAWVTDLVEGVTVRDYHTQPYSIYYDDDEEWAENRPYMTDDRIDPDGDGLYETIEMFAYQLNVDRAQWEPMAVNGEPLYSHIVARAERGYRTAADEDSMARPIPNGFARPGRAYPFVPAAYLRSVQSTGTYGPGAMADQSIGIYGEDYSAIPIRGSGVFAIGQPIPKACWRVRVVDECGSAVLGAPVTVRGVSHGFFSESQTDSDGLTCFEVGRSESNGEDFDGDGLSNELFDVEFELERPIRARRLRAPAPKVESTPTTEGSCREPSNCPELTFQYTNCQ